MTLNVRDHLDFYFFLFLVYSFPHSHLNGNGFNSIRVGSVDLRSGLHGKALDQYVKLVVKEGFVFWRENEEWASIFVTRKTTKKCGPLVFF